MDLVRLLSSSRVLSYSIHFGAGPIAFRGHAAFLIGSLLAVFGQCMLSLWPGESSKFMKSYAYEHNGFGNRILKKLLLVLGNGLRCEHANRRSMNSQRLML